MDLVSGCKGNPKKPLRWGKVMKGSLLKNLWFQKGLGFSTSLNLLKAGNDNKGANEGG